MKRCNDYSSFDCLFVLKQSIVSSNKWDNNKRCHVIVMEFLVLSNARIKNEIKENQLFYFYFEISKKSRASGKEGMMLYCPDIIV